MSSQEYKNWLFTIISWISFQLYINITNRVHSYHLVLSWRISLYIIIQQIMIDPFIWQISWNLSPLYFDTTNGYTSFHLKIISWWLLTPFTLSQSYLHSDAMTAINSSIYTVIFFQIYFLINMKVFKFIFAHIKIKIFENYDISLKILM